VTDDIVLHRQGHALVVTLNRPEVRNALRQESYDALEEAVRTCTARCIVITGRDPAFCAGDDVQQMLVPSGEQARARPPRRRLTPAAEALAHTSIPVIAAVNGAAVGWGMELALLADIRIASERARFAELFVARGLCCDAPGLLRLARLIGWDRAARMLFTAEVVDATSAARIGLVTEVVAHGDLMASAMALAEAIAAQPPLAVQQIKVGLVAALEPNWDEVGRHVGAGLDRLFTTDDHREAIAAYRQKRQGHFTGA
jgi:enoyl-CoA hydratase